MSATSVKVKRSSVSGMSMGGQGGLAMVPGIVLLVMIVLQLIGFSGFKDWLGAIGFTSPASWAVIILIVEFLGMLSFFGMALPPMARMVSRAFAVIAGGFWFVENLRVVSDGTASSLSSSGFFGKYLQQTPGWWTVVEVTIFMLWILMALGLDQEG